MIGIGLAFASGSGEPGGASCRREAVASLKSKSGRGFPMRYVIGICVLAIAAILIGSELFRAQHPSLPWVKRRRARRLRWQWARRPAGMADNEAVAAAPPSPASAQ